MRMILFWKSASTPAASRTVHHYHDEEEHEYSNSNLQEATSSSLSSISLTVWRKSLVFSCKGFTVIGSDGSLVYRVDNYTGHPHHIILMDGFGNAIFTICRPKKLQRLVDNYWLVYEGEVGSNTASTTKKPIYCVRKYTSIMKTTKRQGILAYVYGGLSEKGHAYTIEGSYVRRSCKILDETRRAVAEIKKKETLTGRGVSFCPEVFDLVVLPGIHSRFAMAVVLLLDQMFS